MFPILEISDLIVQYRQFMLGPINCSIKEGSFVSLIGPNGSGKTTLLRSLLCLNGHVTDGSVLFQHKLLTRDSRKPFSQIGYISDSANDTLVEFTVREYWNYCKLAYERVNVEALVGWDERANRYAQILNLPITKRPLSALSLGTRRKAQIIAALLPDPQLLILDEPFIGLDFLVSRAFEALLEDLHRSGMTILSSSHDLDLSSRQADYVLVLRNGKIILNNSVDALSEGLENSVLRALNSVQDGRMVGGQSGDNSNG